MSRRLSADAVRRSVERLTEELGDRDAERLGRLVELIDDAHHINVAAALKAVFPEFDRGDALTRMRQLRRRIHEAAQDADLDLQLVVDSKKRSAPDERSYWFEGGDEAAAQAAAFSKESVRRGVEQERVPQSGVPVRGGKRVVQGVMCAAGTEDDVDLLKRLRRRAVLDPDYHFELWDVSQMLAGTTLDEELRRRVDETQVALVFLSVELLASEGDEREMLDLCRRGLDSPDAAFPMPVVVGTLPSRQSLDLAGFERQHCFTGSDGKAYAECETEPQRDAFVDGLLLDLRRWIEGRPKAEPVDPGIFHELAEGRCLPEAFVGPRGVPAQLRRDAEPVASPRADKGQGQGTVEALDHLEKWATREGGPPYFALLGEYGIGKTTTCEALTLRLLAAGKEDETVPLPIYLDLRRLGKAAQGSPKLSEILTATLEGSWTTGQRLTPDDIVRLVREGRALVIFDGLDEVLVHLDTADGQRFTRELWSILPPRLFDDRAEGAAGERTGRVLISCRTHYFRTVREQSTHFVGEGREGLRAEHYDAFLLLPFDEGQIRVYLEQSVPGRRVDELLELLAGVHNLTELAERPYLLSLIAEQIERLEQARLRGEIVTGVSLYRHVAQSWLERDTGKHQLAPDHKLRLMEHLAWQPWTRGQRSWHIDDVEGWLVDFLASDTRLAFEYGRVDVQLLKEDLRTATFLVGPEDDTFRFAHTSLQEYFLASALARALREWRFEVWDLAVPSVETLDFLGQMLAEEGSDDALAALREIRGAYRERISVLALHYALRAHARGYPAPSLAGWRLEGADLRGLRFVGSENGPRLNLRGAVLLGCRLGGAIFRRVDLSQADFTDADLLRAEMHDCRADGASFEGATATGAIFRQGRFDGSRWRGAKTYRTQWLWCSMDRGA